MFTISRGSGWGVCVWGGGGGGGGGGGYKCQLSDKILTIYQLSVKF